MRGLNLKLPADALEQLQQQAERLRCYPSALARALLVKGLRELSDSPSIR